MVTLQDISSKLMRPAKDLADWNFPLSQVLEEYYSLLEEPTDINFGEAALVLQNSANAYVRRVEVLHDETVNLNDTVTKYEKKEDKAGPTKTDGKNKKRSNIDLNDFQPSDFNQEIGKNINIKNHVGAQKHIKLISRRFTQLEDNTAQLRIAVELYDIHGEVIGKKYDFRCNQHLNFNGILVEEFGPNDFTYNVVSENDYHQICGVMAQTDTCIDSDCDAVENEFIPTMGDDPGNLLETGITSTNDLSACLESSNIDDSGIASGNTSMEEQHDALPSNLNPETVDIREVEDSLNTLNSVNTIENVNNGEENEKSGATAHKETVNSTEDSSNKKHEYPDPSITCSSNNTDANAHGVCISNDTEDQVVEILKRKRGTRNNKKKVVSEATAINEKIWEPIPFTDGVPDKPPASRAEFKLPCHISLLEPEPAKRKRKISTTPQKLECLMQFFLNESGVPHKKMTTYSPVSQTFTPLKKEELEDFQKSFDDCFKNIPSYDVLDYEAVTTITMDLIGFRPNLAKKDPILDQFTCMNETSIIDPMTTDTDGLLSAPSPFETPDASPRRSSSPYDGFPRANSTPFTENYHTLVARKINRICEESDVRTEVERAIERWHEILQPKLLEAENKPVFRIREYGDKIINNLKTTNEQKVLFDQVVRNQPPCEVARYFLATLQLANTYSVDINVDEKHSTNIELILLDRKRTF